MKTSGGGYYRNSDYILYMYAYISKTFLVNVVNAILGIPSLKANTFLNTIN